MFVGILSEYSTLYNRRKQEKEDIFLTFLPNVMLDSDLIPFQHLEKEKSKIVSMKLRKTESKESRQV